MESIDAEHLYDERGDVARSRPIFQGDIFEGIVLPGFGDDPRLVQIVAHPCSMREGTNLVRASPLRRLRSIVVSREMDGTGT